MSSALLSPIRSLAELPEYRQVLWNLVARNLKVKYQRSVLGFLWTLLYPAIMIAIYVAVFGVVLQSGIENFPAYLIAGLLPFQFLISAVVEGAGSIRSNANLIRKVYFPGEILVIATVTAKLVEFLLQLLVAIVFLAFLHHGQAAHISLYKSAIVLPGAIALLYLLALGLALPLAGWSVIYRDLEHIVGLAMTAWFYLTPIFWSIGQAQGHLGRNTAWMALNPALDVVELFRGPLYWGRLPYNSATGGGSALAWLIASAGVALIFAIGYTLFNRSKHVLAEVV